VIAMYRVKVFWVGDVEKDTPRDIDADSYKIYQDVIKLTHKNKQYFLNKEYIALIEIEEIEEHS